jgi:4-hydroxybenzoate polyprenyltransferase
MGRRLFNFFVYSNLFIAVCAVIMVNQTYRLLLHQTPDIYFLLFVFFASICSYSFHWWLTSESVIPSPRIEWVNRNRILHLILFFVGLAGAAVFFLILSANWYWLLLSAIITFLYSAPKIPHPVFRALRKIALGKTIFLALVWTYVTVLLPLLISNRPWQTDFTLFAVSRFFLVYGICILFDYRDREDDKAQGIRSLVTYMDKGSILYLFIFSLLLFVFVTLLLLNHN